MLDGCAQQGGSEVPLRPGSRAVHFFACFIARASSEHVDNADDFLASVLSLVVTTPPSWPAVQSHHSAPQPSRPPAGSLLLQLFGRRTVGRSDSFVRRQPASAGRRRSRPNRG